MQSTPPVGCQRKPKETIMTTLLANRAGTAFSNTPAISSLTAWFSRLAEGIRARHRMARDMATLRSFDPHMLADIGLKGFHHLPEDGQVALLRAAQRNNRLPN
jgi:uncharacterized protein YjiS (DUF1127 family)